jgi:hypothetical protein
MSDGCHIDWDRGIIHFDDGSSGQIIELLDDNGEETDDPDEAAAFLVEDALGQRSLVELGEPQTAH